MRRFALALCLAPLAAAPAFAQSLARDVHLMSMGVDAGIAQAIVRQDAARDNFGFEPGDGRPVLGGIAGLPTDLSVRPVARPAAAPAARVARVAPVVTPERRTVSKKKRLSFDKLWQTGIYQ
jgi:hypothetical protein